MTEDRRLIKFLSIPSKRTVKDFIGTICRQLNFTRTNYKDINGLFVENLPNNRYHLHVYSRNDDFKQQLQSIAKSTNSPNYLSVEINKINHLVILPPINHSIYRVHQMERDCELYEKVIEFTTGAHKTIMDILLMIDINKYKIQYVVCNRTKTFIALQNGTDAMEMMELLRSQHFTPRFATCYAKITYVEGNVNSQANNISHDQEQELLNNNQAQTTQRHVVSTQNMSQPQNNMFTPRFNTIRRGNVLRRANNLRHNINVVQQRNMVAQQNIRFLPSLQPQHFRNNIMRRSNNRRNNLGAARFVRVMFPDDFQNNQYEMRLVRRF